MLHADPGGAGAPCWAGTGRYCRLGSALVLPMLPGTVGEGGDPRRLSVKGDPSCYACVGEDRGLSHGSCHHMPVLLHVRHVLYNPQLKSSV